MPSNAVRVRCPDPVRVRQPLKRRRCRRRVASGQGVATAAAEFFGQTPTALRVARGITSDRGSFAVLGSGGQQVGGQGGGFTGFEFRSRHPAPGIESVRVEQVGRQSGRLPLVPESKGLVPAPRGVFLVSAKLFAQAPKHGELRSRRDRGGRNLTAAGRPAPACRRGRRRARRASRRPPRPAPGRSGFRRGRRRARWAGSRGGGIERRRRDEPRRRVHSRPGGRIAVAGRAADFGVEAAAVRDLGSRRRGCRIRRGIVAEAASQVRGDVRGLPTRLGDLGRKQSRHPGLWSQRLRVEQPLFDPSRSETGADVVECGSCRLEFRHAVRRSARRGVATDAHGVGDEVSGSSPCPAPVERRRVGTPKPFRRQGFLRQVVVVPGQAEGGVPGRRAVVDEFDRIEALVQAHLAVGRQGSVSSGKLLPRDDDFAADAQLQGPRAAHAEPVRVVQVEFDCASKGGLEGTGIEEGACGPALGNVEGGQACDPGVGRAVGRTESERQAGLVEDRCRVR